MSVVRCVEEGTPPAAVQGDESYHYASLLTRYDGTRRQAPTAQRYESDDNDNSTIDVLFDVEATDGGREEVRVSVRRTETMLAVTERVAAAIGRTHQSVFDMLGVAAGKEQQTVAEASPSLSLPWRQALTDEDNRFAVPRLSAQSSPRDQDDRVKVAARESLEHVLLAEVTHLEEQRAKISAQLRHAETELAAMELRCTKLQTECLGFQSEFVEMSRDHDQLCGEHKRLSEECHQQAEQLQRMASERDAIRASVLQAHAATATELSVSKVMEQLEDELYRLQCAIGGLGEEQVVHLTGSGTGAVTADDDDGTRATTYSSECTRISELEEALSALRFEYENLQSEFLRSEEEHTLEIERLETEHAATMSAHREESAAVITQLSTDHSRVVKHLQEDAAYATAIATGGGGSGDAADEFGELTRRHRGALRALQACHDEEMDSLREEHAAQLARHTQELEAVSFLVEVPLVKPLTATELRNIAAMTVSEYYEDESIVEQGEEGDSMYVIQSGTAVAEKDGRRVATYGPRDFFGERVLVMSGSSDGDASRAGARAATVRADGPVRCLRLGRGPVQELMQRYEHIKEVLEAQSRQYGMDDKQGTEDSNAGTKPERTHSDYHMAESRDTMSMEEKRSTPSSQPSGTDKDSNTSRGNIGARSMEPTVVSTTILALLVEAVRTVSRATARGAQLSESERRYHALQQEFENLTAAYKYKQQEQAAFQSKLAAMAATEAEALAAKSASAEALKTVVGGYQAHIRANSEEVRSTKAAHESLQAENQKLSTELRAVQNNLAATTASADSEKAKAKAELSEALASLSRAREELATTTAFLSTEQDKFKQQQEENHTLHASLADMRHAMQRLDTQRSQDVAAAATATAQSVEALKVEQARVKEMETKYTQTQQGLKAQAERCRQIEHREAATVRAARVLQNLMTRVDTGQFFERFDTNGDGKITKAELREACCQMGLLPLLCTEWEQLTTASDEMKQSQPQPQLAPAAPVLSESDEQAVTLTMDAIMCFVDADGDGTIDTSELLRFGQMKEELQHISSQMALARQDAEAKVVTLIAERDIAQKQVVVLEESLVASQEQLAGMFKSAETQHWGLTQLQEQLKQAEENEKCTQALLDASVKAAEQQRSNFNVEAAELRQELAKVTEEAQLSEVALTAAMDVVEHCRTKVSAADWLEIGSLSKGAL